MQQIYPTGAGAVSLEEGWIEIAKPENFRSSDTVLSLVNQIRADGDALVQESPPRSSDQPPGEAFLFVLPADNERTANLDAVRSWLDKHSKLGNWSRSDTDGGAKVLMITHRMAARRLDFMGLWQSFDDHGSQAVSDSFASGTTWVLAPFRDVIEPICSAATVRSPDVLSILRAHSPLLAPSLTGSEVKSGLSSAKDAVAHLRGLSQSDSSLGELLNSARTSGLLELEPRLGVYLDPHGPHEAVVLEDADRELIGRVLACPYSELKGYRDYVNRVSPYSTHHGTKGAEFERVVVVVDGEEGRFPNISYEKLLGLEALTDTDRRNIASGADSVLDRSRRLFYVCVSRARLGVAIVLFTANVQAALQLLQAGPLAPLVEMHGVEDVLAEREQPGERSIV